MWILAAITLGVLSYQMRWIAPYTPLFPMEVASNKNVDSQRAIRVMTANVLTPNRNSEALLKLVRENDPDVLITLESDAWWQRHLDALTPIYPHAVKCPLDNLYGMHLYSKLPLIDPRIEYLVEDDKPSIHTLLRLRSGHEIRAHFLHPAPPSPTENSTSSERDAELLVIAKSIAKTNEPTIVTGDLNDVAWSATTRLFRKISGLLDPRIGRGLFNTFHANYWFMRWPLDHIFHSHHFQLSNLRRLRGFGSDHFALFAELVFAPQNEAERGALEADAEDMAWAKAKIDSQDVDVKDVPRPG